MQKFTDAKGREWDLSLSMLDLKRLREAGLIDFAALSGDHEQFVRRMYFQSDELLPVIWAIASRKQTSLGFVFTEDDFLDAVTGPVQDAAVVALWHAFASMFRRTPIGLRIRADGPEKVMAGIEAAILAAPDEPAKAEPATAVTPAPLRVVVMDSTTPA